MILQILEWVAREPDASYRMGLFLGFVVGALCFTAIFITSIRRMK